MDDEGVRRSVLERAETALRNGDLDGALEALGETMDDTVVRRTAMRVMLASRRGSVTELAEREVETHPDDPEAWALMACASLSDGDERRYIGSWERAYELEPDSYDVILGLAVAEDEVGDPERAMDLYLEALAIRRDDVPTMFRLAQALESNGEVEDALSMYERIIDIEPNNGPVLNCLSNIYGSVLHDFDRARGCCERCLSVFPDDPYSLAVIEWLDQRTEDGA